MMHPALGDPVVRVVPVPVPVPVLVLVPVRAARGEAGVTDLVTGLAARVVQAALVVPVAPAGLTVPVVLGRAVLVVPGPAALVVLAVLDLAVLDPAVLVVLVALVALVVLDPAARVDRRRLLMYRTATTTAAVRSGAARGTHRMASARPITVRRLRRRCMVSGGTVDLHPEAHRPTGTAHRLLEAGMDRHLPADGTNAGMAQRAT